MTIRKRKIQSIDGRLLADLCHSSAAPCQRCNITALVRPRPQECWTPHWLSPPHAPKLPRVTFAKTLLLTVLPALAQADTCLDHPYEAPGHPLAVDIALLRTALVPFESLNRSLDSARPRICLTEGPADALGTFGAEENLITVGADLPPAKRVAVLIHEVRHLDQNARGYCPSVELDMRANARAVFALEADAMAITHLVAWALSEEGDGSVFDALATSSETPDIAAAFRAEIEISGDPSRATAAAFDAWYASDVRRERYYVSTCTAYLDRIDEEHRFSGTAGLAADFLADICLLPGGAPYPCEEPGNPLPR